MPRRFRFPPSTVLLVLLAVIAGIAVAVSTSLSIIAYSRIDETVTTNRELIDRVTDAQAATYRSRREAARLGCRRDERLKRDLRVILMGFGIDPKTLPSSKDGRPALTPRDCAAYVDAVVPKDTRPETSTDTSPDTRPEAP